VSEIPIVVFTGKSLTAEEEQQLKTVAKSIVLKDVQSPERLFDEDGVVLHRVVANLRGQCGDAGAVAFIQ